MIPYSVEIFTNLLILFFRSRIATFLVVPEIFFFMIFIMASGAQRMATNSCDAQDSRKVLTSTALVVKAMVRTVANV